MCVWCVHVCVRMFAWCVCACACACGVCARACMCVWCVWCVCMCDPTQPDPCGLRPPLRVPAISTAASPALRAAPRLPPATLLESPPQGRHVHGVTDRLSPHEHNRPEARQAAPVTGPRLPSPTANSAPRGVVPQRVTALRGVTAVVDRPRAAGPAAPARLTAVGDGKAQTAWSRLQRAAVLWRDQWGSGVPVPGRERPGPWLSPWLAWVREGPAGRPGWSWG